MRSGAGRLLYDIIFIAGLAALVYANRGLYVEVKNMLDPYLQAYTPVGMFLIAVALLLFANWLREAIAGSFVAATHSLSGYSPLNLESGKQSQNVLKSARRLLRRGEFQAAGEAFESLDMWRDAALAYQKGNIFGKAARAWEQAEEPGRALELFEREGSNEAAAILSLREGLPDRARRNFRLAGDRAMEHNQISRAGEFYEKAEDYARAAAVFEQSHKLDRALAAYEKANNCDKVIALLKDLHPSEYLRRGQQFTQIVERCAELLARNEHVPDAAEILEEAHAYTRAAELYSQSKMWKQSAELYLKADQPDAAEAMAGKIEDPQEAADLLARLATSRGDWASAGKYYMTAGKSAQALDAYKKAREFEKAAAIYEDMGRFILAGEMYSAAKNLSAAANAYAKAYDWRNAGECFEHTNDLPQAIEAYSNAGMYLRAGKLALKSTDYARAVEYLQRIPDSSPDSQAGSAFLATAFYHQGHLEMAYELFSNSMQGLPINRENLPAFYAWASYLEKHDPRQSLTIFRQILGIDIHYSDVADRIPHLEKVVTSLSREMARATPAYVQQIRPEFTPPSGMTPPVAAPSQLHRGHGTAASTDVASSPYATPLPLASGRAEAPPLVAHRYQIQAPVTQMGKIQDFSALDTTTALSVMLRLFPRPDDDGIYEATTTLLENAEKLSHPGLAPVQDFGLEDRTVYVVSPAVAGQNLHQFIRTSGPMSLNDARAMLLRILEALDYAHSQDVCHLNLRPDVIFRSTENPPAYTLTGFGVPVRQPENSETMYVTAPDIDPQYMAPEQIIGTDVDARTDIYAFGLLMYFVLTGRTPFDVKRIQDTQEIARMQVQSAFTRPSTIRATLPTSVDDVFLKCVYKSPMSRYQSVSELVADIRNMLPTAPPGQQK